MAFDRPIEADRIDDFNIFTAFIRAPLWLLGGVLGGNMMDDNAPVKNRRLDDNIPNENSPPGSGENSPCRKRVVSDEDLATSSSRRSAIGDEGYDDIVRHGEVSGLYIKGPPGLKRSKNLSWSDESGKSLVEYNDESVRHDPSPYSSVTSTSAPKPSKSAMRRSRSIRSAADTIEQTQDSTRYIPHMTAAKNGLIIPTRPFGNDGVSNGVESPQLGYGFYMNLTPPTPEMYQTYTSKHPRSLLGPGMHTNPNSLPSGRSQQNQVFQNLQNNQAPMGWSSVPI